MTAPPPEGTTALVVQLQEPGGGWVPVGHLRSRHDRTAFRSSPAYWLLPDRPVLGQVFEQHEPSWEPIARTALPSWFSHLLSEGRLREAVSRALGVSPARELPLLARLGADDLPGAVRVLPADDDGAAVVPEHADDADDETTDDLALKFSLAGVQVKFSLTRGDRGPTVPVSGAAGDVILKLPDPRPGYEGVPQAEFAAMRLARAAGLDVPGVALTDASDVAGLEGWPEVRTGPSFLIERFDRLPGGRRLHAEELAQVLDISTTADRAKYTSTNFETVANAVAGLAGVDHVEEVVRRIVLNVLVGNGNAHLKNWAFTYPDGTNPQLSPLYDVVPTVLFIAGDDLGLKLNGSRAFDDVTSTSFDGIGERTEFGVASVRGVVRAGVQAVMDHWGELAEPLSAEHLQRLTRRLESLPLVTDRRPV